MAIKCCKKVLLLQSFHAGECANFRSFPMISVAVFWAFLCRLSQSDRENIAFWRWAKLETCARYQLHWSFFNVTTQAMMLLDTRQAWHSRPMSHWKQDSTDHVSYSTWNLARWLLRCKPIASMNQSNCHFYVP